jgi:signal transduction histidine kinase
MARARDEARTIISGKVRLVQETDTDVQPGFLIFIPVYKTPTIPTTVEERRAQFLGWAYSPFRTHDLFRNIILGIPDGSTQLSFAVYDGTTMSPDNLLYRTDSVRADSPLAATRTLDAAGRTWTVDFATASPFDADSNRMYALYILLGGLLTTLLLSGAALLQARAAIAAESARSDLQFVNTELETQFERVQQRTADLREANNEIQRFAYIVSHDLRSPLVNIMGFTTELEALRADMFERLAALRPAEDSDGKEKDDNLDRDFDEALNFIKTSIGKMDRLINSILKLSREGRREFRPEYINMNQLFRGIVDGQAHKAAELQAEIHIGDVPAVYSDRLALEQIFSNLVDNALKYLQDGRPGRIHIRGRSTPAANIYEVEDNGRGIAAEDHDRIFDLFRRAGPQDRPGEGIGLAHVRALVRRLGGQMKLRSALGNGSTFIVSLPRRWMGEQTIDERTTA